MMADDPTIKVTVFMPASTLQRLRDHARLSKSSVSRLCRDGALRALELAAEPDLVREAAP